MADDQTDYGGDFTDSNPPDVIASTGAADNNPSFWGNLFQSALTQTVNTGIPIAGQALRQQLNLQTPQAQSSGGGGGGLSPAASGGGISGSLGLAHGPSNTMLYVIAGAVVLFLAWMLTKGK